MMTIPVSSCCTLEHIVAGDGGHPGDVLSLKARARMRIRVECSAQVIFT